MYFVDFWFCFWCFQKLTAKFWFHLNRFKILKFRTWQWQKLKKSISQLPMLEWMSRKANDKTLLELRWVFTFFILICREESFGWTHLSIFLFHVFIIWLTDWLVYWLADWLIKWLIDWLFDCLTDWLFDLLTDWVIDWLVNWLVNWLTDCLVYWLTDWFIDWFIDYLTDWLIDYLSYWLIDWLTS